MPLRRFKFDNSPIGMMHIASDGHRSATNPHGFLFDKAIDTESAAGRVIFRQRLLQWAHNSIPILQAIRSHRMIVWAWEGVRYGSYCGSPDLCDRLVGPWYLPMAREFAAVFHEAGIELGAGIRHQVLKDNPVEDATDNMIDGPSPLHVLASKMYWARYKSGLGCQHFYIDSDVDSSFQPLNAGMFEMLHKFFPDCTMYPEWESPEGAQFYVSYREAQIDDAYNGFFVDKATRAVVPNAVSMINVQKVENIAGRIDDLRASMAAGNALAVNCWCGSEAVEAVKRVVN